MTWTSSNPTIATVNGVGKVTAVADGTVRIDAVTQDGKHTAYSTVTVSGSAAAVVPVTGIDVSPATVSLKIGATHLLKATISPDNATNKAVTWTSSKTSVATVNSTGLVTGLAAGSATITATTTDGKKTATSVITVANGGSSRNNIVVEAENFTKTGGTYNDGKVPFGVNKAGNSINFVNSGDWADYTVNASTSGSYSVEYMLGTTVNGAAIEFILDNKSVMTDAVPNNGSWDNYVSLNASKQVSLKAGQNTIRLKGAGTNGWEWNLDKVILKPVAQTKSAESASDIAKQELKQLKMYPNPVYDDLTVYYNASSDTPATLNIYNTLGKLIISTELVNGSNTIDVSNLQPASYIVKLLDGDRFEIKQFIKN